MDCRKFQQHISSLLDGELEETSAALVSEHVAVCLDCRQLYERLCSLNNSVQSLPFPVPVHNLAEQVKVRIAAVTDRTPEASSPGLWSRLSVLAMILMLAIGVGNLAGRSMGDFFVTSNQEASADFTVQEEVPLFADLVPEITTEDNSR